MIKINDETHSSVKVDGTNVRSCFIDEFQLLIFLFGFSASTSFETIFWIWIKFRFFIIFRNLLKICWKFWIFQLHKTILLKDVDLKTTNLYQLNSHLNFFWWTWKKEVIKFVSSSTSSSLFLKIILEKNESNWSWDFIQRKHLIWFK